MSNERIFLKCKECGNIVGVIQNSGAPIFCCGQEMQELKANTTDAAVEKHVPVLEKVDGELKVSVGSVAHPMTAEHYIAWIAVAQGDYTTRIALEPGDTPCAVFCVQDGLPVTVYAYCNLHGLWMQKME